MDVKGHNAEAERQTSEMANGPGHQNDIDPEKVDSNSISDTSSHLAGNLAALTDPDQKRTIEQNAFLRKLQRAAEWLSRFNIESIGIAPLRKEQRIVRQWWSPGLLWFSANVNVLTFSGGTLAPSLGLGMVASQITILLFSAVLSIPAAYFSCFGPQLGMRQMVQARYSWGYFPTCIACLLNAAGMIGFTTLNNILGGQTLSAVPKDDTLSATVGIVIIAVVSLLVSFSGIRILHLFERWLWLPVLICFCILIGLAGTGPEGLHIPTNDAPLEARAVLGMGAVVAGYLVAWAPLGSDVTHYISPDVPSYKIFIAVFLGFFLSTAPIMMLGAAFAISAKDIPSWESALQVSNGALYDVILTGPGGVGNFGRFLLVILALSAIGNIAATLYSFGLTLQTLLPLLGYVPRFIWPVLATAIVLPLAIVGADHFYTTLSNFSAVLGYWASLFVAVVLVEHVVIRKRKFELYDTSVWNDYRKLPLGVAALVSAILSLGLVIPSMDQVWFSGPIAKKSGDLGFELGFVICCIIYIPLRLLEKHLTGH